jgi:hypothetical protein
MSDRFRNILCVREYGESHGLSTLDDPLPAFGDCIVLL